MSILSSEVESPYREDVLANGDPRRAGARPAGELPRVNGRIEIARLVAAERDYRVLFERMMEVASRFVDFDWASLFVFSPKREYSRIVRWYGPPMKWESRWFQTDANYLDWMDQPETWMEDFKECILKGPSPHMLERPDVKIMLEVGTRALVALPVREGGEIKGGLCLLSKQKGIYGEETRRKLERLMLDQALLAVFRGEERAETMRGAAP